MLQNGLPAFEDTGFSDPTKKKCYYCLFLFLFPPFREQIRLEKKNGKKVLEEVVMSHGIITMTTTSGSL